MVDEGHRLRKGYEHGQIHEEQPRPAMDSRPPDKSRCNGRPSIWSAGLAAGPACGGITLGPWSSLVRPNLGWQSRHHIVTSTCLAAALGGLNRGHFLSLPSI